MIKFIRQGYRPDGETLYRLVIDGEIVREGLTLDQVIRAINRRDEERLGEEHTKSCQNGGINQAD